MCFCLCISVFILPAQPQPLLCLPLLCPAHTALFRFASPLPGQYIYLALPIPKGGGVEVEQIINNKNCKKIGENFKGLSSLKPSNERLG